MKIYCEISLSSRNCPLEIKPVMTDSGSGNNVQEQTDQDLSDYACWLSSSSTARVGKLNTDDALLRLKKETSLF